MKKLIFIIGAATIIGLMIFNLSCTSQRELSAQKSGAQLWGENCLRCHNTPSPSAYNDVDWETIGLHMRVRANLTEEETIKIVDFLKMAN